MGEYEFKITNLSKGLSISDVQRATLTLFSTPMKFPEDSPKFMTLEEFILGDTKNEEVQD